MRNGLVGRRGWRWRLGRAWGWQFDAFQFTAELLYLFLEHLDLTFEFGIEVLASYIGEKKDGNRADN